MPGVARQTLMERDLELLEPLAPEVPPHSKQCPETGKRYRGEKCPMCDVVHAAPPAPTEEEPAADDEGAEEEEEPDLAKAKTCSNGHALTKANTDPSGRCRECTREYQRAYYARTKGNGAERHTPPKARKAKAAPAGPIATTIAALREERDVLAERLAKLDQVIAALEEIAGG